MNNKKMLFSVENIEVLEPEIDKSQFARLLVDCFSTAPSRHETYVSVETLKKMSRSILLKPFVFVIDERFNDIGGHDPREIAGGFVPHNTPITFHEMPDGHTMMRCEVLVWKRYSGKLLEYFKRDDNKKGVSVEIEILEFREDEKSGLTELLDYCFNAITCLGNFIQPAIHNAQAVLQFSQDYEEAKKDYLSKKYGSIDFLIPDEVKATARHALYEYALDSKQASAISLSNARFLIKNESITPERVRRLYTHLSKTDDVDELEYSLLGGQSGKEWVGKIVTAMDEDDKKQLAYDDKGNTTEESLEHKYDSVADNYLGMEEKTNKMANEKDVKTEEMAAPEPEPEEEETSGQDGDEQEMAAEDQAPPAKEEEDGKTNMAMSLNQYLDVSALLEMLQSETISYRSMKEAEAVKFSIDALVAEIAKGAEANIKLVTGSMIGFMKSASKLLSTALSQNQTFSAENKALKEFRETTENEKKNFEVESVLKEAFMAGMPDAEIQECREDAKNFSLNEIDFYKNKVKAKAFQYFGKREEKEESDNIVRAAFPFSQPKHEEPRLWQ